MLKTSNYCVNVHIFNCMVHIVESVDVEGNFTTFYALERLAQLNKTEHWQEIEDVLKCYLDPPRKRVVGRVLGIIHLGSPLYYRI